MFIVIKKKFNKWKGKPLVNTYGGKPVVNYKGKPFFVELAVVEMQKEKGWNAVWIDNFKKSFRTSMINIKPLKKLPMDTLLFLQEIAGKSNLSGCWDVVAWKGKKYKFFECKRKGKDKIRLGQIKWYKNAVKTGLPKSAFRVVEWIEV